MTDLSLLARLAELEQTLGSEELFARLAAIDGAGGTGSASGPVARRPSRRPDGRAWGSPHQARKRGRDGWEVRPSLSDGSRPRVWAKTRDELWDEVDRRERAIRINPGEDAPKDYNGACDRMLAVYRGRDSSRRSLEYDLNASRREFGPDPYERITRYRIETWLTDLATKPSPFTGRILSPLTQANYLAALKRPLQFGVEHEWWPRNRAAGLYVDVGEANPEPFESWDELFQVAHAFTGIGWAVGSRITRFAAGLGLRLQEVLVARECDLDRAAGTFHVQRSWDDTLRIEVAMTKTHGSNAILPFTPVAFEVVEETPTSHARDPRDWRTSPLLFTRPDGRAISTDYFLRKWHGAMDTLPDLAYRPPKNLRHSFALLMLLQLGTDKIKIVADLMRHDSYRTTERYYIKKVQEIRRRAAAEAAADMPRFADFH